MKKFGKRYAISTPRPRVAPHRPIVFVVFCCWLAIHPWLHHHSTEQTARTKKGNTSNATKKHRDCDTFADKNTTADSRTQGDVLGRVAGTCRNGTLGKRWVCQSHPTEDDDNGKGRSLRKEGGVGGGGRGDHPQVAPHAIVTSFLSSVFFLISSY